MKYCCFRFDADTHACVARGIPRLVELGDQLGVKFTFFVNMGRSFDPRITVAKAVARWLQGGRRGSLSAAGKLGWREALVAAILNPKAGRSNPDALRAAVRSGHEIGLHGGRNHAWWERSAQRWSAERLNRDIETGLRWLEDCGVPAPNAFSSPAWNSPPALLRLLPMHSIRILADTYDPAWNGPRMQSSLLSMPTNITAEPATAGYLEIMRLRGWSRARIAEDFRMQLASKQQFAMVYDHPFFAGIHALDQVADLIEIAQDEGFLVETVSTAAEALGATMEETYVAQV